MKNLLGNFPVENSCGATHKKRGVIWGHQGSSAPSHHPHFTQNTTSPENMRFSENFNNFLLFMVQSGKYTV
jgi:hypothetical protein